MFKKFIVLFSLILVLVSFSCIIVSADTDWDSVNIPFNRWFTNLNLSDPTLAMSITGNSAFNNYFPTKYVYRRLSDNYISTTTTFDESLYEYIGLYYGNVGYLGSSYGAPPQDIVIQFPTGHITFNLQSGDEFRFLLDDFNFKFTTDNIIIDNVQFRFMVNYSDGSGESLNFDFKNSDITYVNTHQFTADFSGQYTVYDSCTVSFVGFTISGVFNKNNSSSFQYYAPSGLDIVYGDPNSPNAPRFPNADDTNEKLDDLDNLESGIIGSVQGGLDNVGNINNSAISGLTSYMSAFQVVAQLTNEVIIRVPVFGSLISISVSIGLLMFLLGVVGTLVLRNARISQQNEVRKNRSYSRGKRKGG